MFESLECSAGDCSTWHVLSDSVFSYRIDAGTLAAAPLPFRPGNPALCGSRPVVTPYYCRLGDLLCFVFMSAYCVLDFSVYYLFLQYFDTVGWVFWPVKTVSHITYTVLAGTYNTAQSNPIELMRCDMFRAVICKEWRHTQAPMLKACTHWAQSLLITEATASPPSLSFQVLQSPDVLYSSRCVGSI